MLRPACLAVLVLLTAASSTAQVPVVGGGWNPDEWGTHRAVVRADGPARAALVTIPWARRDAHPDSVAVWVVEAATGERVHNVARLASSMAFGTIAFEAERTGVYYVYYLPYEGTPQSYYPQVNYVRAEDTSDPAWRARTGLVDGQLDTAIGAVIARVEAIQVANDFHDTGDMSRPATPADIDRFLDRQPDAEYFVFPEDRTRPIELLRTIPQAWAERQRQPYVVGWPHRGEYFVFQLGVWAARSELANLGLGYEALRGPDGATVPPSAFTSINLEGVDPAGEAFTRRVDVPEGRVQPLWVGIDLPDDLPPGHYTGAITVIGEAACATRIPIELEILDETLPARGDDDIWRRSRLRWLNSTLALDDGLVAPYTPIEVDGTTLSVLGRDVALAPNGLPASIQSRFAIEMTRLTDTPREVLARPMRFVVDDASSQPFDLRPSGVEITSQTDGTVKWTATSSNGTVSLRLYGRMEFDGTLELKVDLTTTREVDLDDVRLEVPVASDVARYLLGMGLKGGAAPDTMNWTWGVERNQEGPWIGDINAGLQILLRDDHYVRPLNTNYYLEQPLHLPESWHNDGQGGIDLARTDDAYEVIAFSGARTLLPNAPFRFDVRLTLTPFHTIDPQAQFATRFWHKFSTLKEVKDAGASVVNVHHANPINPYINYPFFVPEATKAYIDAAHADSMRVKLYYTVRELTTRAPELFMLQSLGDEVFSSGDGGGQIWLQEHLDGDYIPGWYAREVDDPAVVTSGVSRWHNFYVEGLDWLARNLGIDGVYIDDVAFDRTTMQRVRRVLDRRRPDPLIDLHSANQFNPRDGYANSAALYLEHLPYVDRLWFGEYFEYDLGPDYWLTEVSGLPFGLMGEMLQDGGNPWRGMIFGMTARMPWGSVVDNRAIWAYWDAVGLGDREMIGYWVPHRPVRTDTPDVIATTYLGDGSAVVALASWAEAPTEVSLAIDWDAIGLAPEEAVIEALPIDGFQEARTFDLGNPIPVAPGKGWLLLIRAR